MKRIIFCFCACLSSFMGVHAQANNVLEVKELTLSNGMSVWLNEDHSQPQVYGAVVVKAGAKDCPGTGIAHYFEHIMFKGTERIGTVDYEKERPWLDSISAQYDLLAKTTDNTTRADIQTKINELSLKAAEYAIPNEFNRLISLYGGSKLNAGTGQDVTFYHNFFLPQFMEQWCWLNSERMLNPVFRSFQAELENVYEEKNRAEDAMGGALDKAMKAVFQDHPYGEPIIGSTESLKNPRLSEMEAFYKKYYVACNMGLILCGDINAEALLPLLEKTFGRIPTGTTPQRNIVPAKPIKPATIPIKLPIPIIGAEALVFNGPTDYDPDAIALEVCNQLLTNGKAGLLDSLTNEHKVLMAMTGRTAFNDVGVQFMLVIPKIPFGKMKKAEAICFEQLEKIKRGDFSEETLEHVKKNMLVEAEQNIETIEERASQMLDVFSQGHTWQDALDQLEQLKHITKNDIIRVANKYYTDSFVRLKKKFGTDKKETLKQPGYKPITPKNSEAKSAFALQLEQMPIDKKDIRLVDFEHDAKRTELSPHITLYSKENAVNDVATFTLRFLDGTLHTPLLDQLAAYLNAIGTDSLSKQKLETAWMKLAATIEITAEQKHFDFKITARDAELHSAIQLLSHFLRHAKADKDALNDIKSTKKVDDKGFGEEKDGVLGAMIEYVRFGLQSTYLTQLSTKETKALKDQQLLDALKELMKYDCELIYCGRKNDTEVAAMAQEILPLDNCHKGMADIYRRPINRNESVVYFYHVPKSRQNYVLTYDMLAPAKTEEERAVARLWGEYMGGGMSSVLFQNIREFQSLAYSTQGVLRMPSIKNHANDSISFFTITGTQADKTAQAMNTLDSLLRQMPMKENNLNAARQDLLNDIQNSYPSFRDIASFIADKREEGYNSNPEAPYTKIIPMVSAQQVANYHQINVANNKRIWIIIGDRKQTDFTMLKKYGKLVELKKENIYK